ncbi:MAG: relaxase/mobilization nuclease domain-containing protein [Steroidobacteraceae bacterium]
MGRVGRRNSCTRLRFPSFPERRRRGVLEAARNFAREEFALKHRYALVLHTDEPHPHMHLIAQRFLE